MEYKKLITEQTFNDIKGELLEESTTGHKRMYISGPFLQAEDRNRNGRVYPKRLIEREVKKFQGLIESKEALGELNHPQDRAEIDPREASILVTELVMDGNLAFGKAKVLSTPCGKLLEALISDGVRMGVSSRGTGNLLEDNIVADDFNLICIDSVYMPSAQCAYTDPIYESVQRVTEWVLNESTGLYVEREVTKEEPVITPEKAETIAIATEKFNKKIDRKGSKEIREAFKEWFKTL